MSNVAPSCETHTFKRSHIVFVFWLLAFLYFVYRRQPFIQHQQCCTVHSVFCRRDHIICWVSWLREQGDHGWRRKFVNGGHGKIPPQHCKADSVALVLRQPLKLSTVSVARRKRLKRCQRKLSTAALLCALCWIRATFRMPRADTRESNLSDMKSRMQQEM